MPIHRYQALLNDLDQEAVHVGHFADATPAIQQFRRIAPIRADGWHLRDMSNY
jgi:hypothetical protein